mgnify:CR=1 FL=1
MIPLVSSNYLVIFIYPIHFLLSAIFNKKCIIVFSQLGGNKKSYILNV